MRPAPKVARPLPAMPSTETEPPSIIGEIPILAQPRWMLQYRIVLLVLDVCAIVLATLTGYQVRFGTRHDLATGFSFVWLAVGMTLAWLVALQYCNAYEIRHLATGPEESKRLLRASGLTLSLLAVTCYVIKTPLARGFVIVVIPLGALLLVLERAAIRRAVSSRRRHGRWSHRIIAVGTTESVEELVAVTERARNAGLQVIGACVQGAPAGSRLPSGVPVLGGVFDAADQAEATNADVVAVTGSGLGPVGVRELGWRLEGTGRGLVMAPALTEIAGTRMHISPVDGLPLVWLEQPRMGRVPQLVKRSMDLLGAFVALAILSPVLLLSAAAVKCTSRGPVFFRQLRLGYNGKEFSILKFRSMVVGAEDLRADILEMNEQDGAGVLFKIRQDPRVTRVGRVMRRLSVDELPQLLQVVTGDMSLVGPRPLAAEDSVYTGSARRRLLVRPGITGLWQVSGRSELSWDDAVRMDLYYVENWSLGLDLTILARTLAAVLTSRGAY
ncbi:sugar transferase [uncultured Jatrophihabitans sp.]|uniref:sugar transferase n=1 Tax=uncultured Jatrophihabitans sp. TaxID=1610747 RepID=UPI0035CA985A